MVKENKELFDSRLLAADCSVMPKETCRKRMFIDEYTVNFIGWEEQDEDYLVVTSDWGDTVYSTVQQGILAKC